MRRRFITNCPLKHFSAQSSYKKFLFSANVSCCRKAGEKTLRARETKRAQQTEEGAGAHLLQVSNWDRRPSSNSLSNNVTIRGEGPGPPGAYLFCRGRGLKNKAGPGPGKNHLNTYHFHILFSKFSLNFGKYLLKIW